jgi:hypothetical protein
MDRAPLPDLNSLGRDALLALIRAQEEEFAAQDAEIRRLEAELETHRQTLSEQTDELHSRSQRIEHLKLMVEKFRQMIFGKKSEKIVLKLEQLEFELEEDETTQAEAEAIAERVSPSILSAKWSRIGPSVTAVPIAVASCGTSVTMFPNNLSMFPRASRSSAMCDRSSPAQAAIVWSKRRRRRGPSSVALPGHRCWRMSSSRSTPTICRCIGSRRSMLVKE